MGIRQWPYADRQHPGFAILPRNAMEQIKRGYSVDFGHHYIQRNQPRTQGLEPLDSFRRIFRFADHKAAQTLKSLP